MSQSLDLAGNLEMPRKRASDSGRDLSPKGNVKSDEGRYHMSVSGL